MDIDEYILSVLSFYEPMSMEKIILDFDHEKLEEFDNLSKEKLDETLESLCDKKLVRKYSKNKELYWIRVFPKRKNILRKLYNYIIRMFK